MDPASYLALLRGINVGGHNRIPMSELRALCGDLGWKGVRTYIQSGNLVFRASAPATRLEEELEHALKHRFSLDVPVIVRSAADWNAYIQGNPYPEASRSGPKQVMLALAKEQPGPDAAAALQARADRGERVSCVGDALWIHYAGGAGRSKLSSALLDRVVGSPVTTRNWRSLLRIQALLHESESGT